MRTKLLGVALLLAMTGLGSWVGYRFGREQTRSVAAPAASGREARATVDMRELVALAAARAPVRGEAELDPHLDTLEREARARGRVTALDVEPGLRLIQTHTGDPERMQEFSERMLRLDRELSGKPASEPRPAAAVRGELRSMLSSLRHPRDEAEKQSIIRDYLRLAAELPEDERAELTRELDAVAVTPPQSLPSDAVELLWGAIEQETVPAERQALIRDYLDALRELPDDERESRLALLDERFGTTRPK